MGRFVDTTTKKGKMAYQRKIGILIEKVKEFEASWCIPH